MASEKTTSVRAVIYCRVSSNEQVKGTSLEMQERLCRDYVERVLGAEMVAVYVEMGESAKTTNRAEFQKAIAFATNKKNKIGYLVVHKIDRFAREQEGHVLMQAALRKYGVKLRSVMEPIDESPIGKAMEGFLSVSAQLDNDVRSLRSKSGMEERVRQGMWPFDAPRGLKRLTKGGNLVVDEETAPYIRLAFREWDKGTYSYKSLAHFLNERGFRTRSGKKLYPQAVEQIIRNPIYAGIVRAFGMETKATFPALIEEELFWRCQPGVRRSLGHTKRVWNNEDFPLRRFVACLVCSTNITGSHSTGRKGVKYPYYHHQKQGCEAALSVSKKDFENGFVGMLTRVSPKHKRYEKIFKAIVMDVWQSNYKKLDADNAQLRKEIENLERARQQVFDAHRTGVYTDEDFVEQKARINMQVQQKKLLLEEKRIEEFSMEEALNFCFDLVRDSGKTWTELYNIPPLRVRFQNLVFPEKVTFDGEKFDTAKMSIVHQLNQTTGTDSSSLVRREGFEPS